MDQARFSTVAHRAHAYCNPLDPALVDQVLGLLDLGPDDRVLDVGCGKGALLIRVAERFGASGTGVDINAAFLAEGRADAARCGVASRVELLEIDASRYAAARGSFDLGICVGASHALGRYAEALGQMRRWVRRGGHLLMGEGYWRREPDPEYLVRLGTAADEISTHAGTLAGGVAEGLIARGSWTSSDRDWDAYEELYARTVETYVVTHPEDPDAPAMRERIARWRETYRRWGRDTLGFGLYLFRRP